jgi:hypothetical protein
MKKKQQQEKQQQYKFNLVVKFHLGIPCPLNNFPSPTAKRELPKCFFFISSRHL